MEYLQHVIPDANLDARIRKNTLDASERFNIQRLAQIEIASTHPSLDTGFLWSIADQRNPQEYVHPHISRFRPRLITALRL